MRAATFAVVAIVSPVVLLTACVTAASWREVNIEMAKTYSSHYSELIAELGPPQGVYDDGEGGRLLVWTFTDQRTTFRFVPRTSTLNLITRTNLNAYDRWLWGTSHTVGTVTTLETIPITRTTSAVVAFWINVDGFVHRFRWRHSDGRWGWGESPQERVRR